MDSGGGVGEQRMLRADAQENYDRLITAAISMFERDGTDASLKSIAEEAGVGIGTLYRRFPTRDRLVEAVYRSRVVAVCDAADALAAAGSPEMAFSTWAGHLVELLVNKQGIAQALRPALSDDADFRTSTRQRLTRSVEVILEAGRREGVFRDDIDSLDLLRGIAGIAYAVEDIDQAKRLIGLLTDGLTVRERDAGR